MFKTIFKLYLVLILFFTVPKSVWAQTYGSDTYGSGVYGGSSSGSGVSNPLTQAGSPTCESIAPVDIADLFQINRIGFNVSLYFTPVKESGSYHVFYGTRDVDQFGAEFVGINSNLGVQSVSIGYLQPGLTYTFKVRGVRDCAGGEFSNTLTLGSYIKTVYRIGGERKSANKPTPTKLINVSELERESAGVSEPTLAPETGDLRVQEQEIETEQQLDLFARLWQFLTGLLR